MNKRKQSRLIGRIVLAKDLRKKENIEKYPKTNQVGTDGGLQKMLW